jgi:hypothetical protein
MSKESLKKDVYTLENVDITEVKSKGFEIDLKEKSELLEVKYHELFDSNQIVSEGMTELQQISVQMAGLNRRKAKIEKDIPPNQQRSRELNGEISSLSRSIVTDSFTPAQIKALKDIDFKAEVDRTLASGVKLEFRSNKMYLLKLSPELKKRLEK